MGEVFLGGFQFFLVIFGGGFMFLRHFPGLWGWGHVLFHARMTRRTYFFVLCTHFTNRITQITSPTKANHIKIYIKQINHKNMYGNKGWKQNHNEGETWHIPFKSVKSMLTFQ